MLVKFTAPGMVPESPEVPQLPVPPTTMFEHCVEDAARASVAMAVARNRSRHDSRAGKGLIIHCYLFQNPNQSALALFLCGMSHARHCSSAAQSFHHFSSALATSSNSDCALAWAASTDACTSAAVTRFSASA